MIGAGLAAQGRRAYLIPLVLFAASAAFTLWRNTQVGVLVDLAYVLNTATRIAAGDVPYAQFPLVLAPGEFLVQALLIKAFGPHFMVLVAYAAIAGGAAAALTYSIGRRLLSGVVQYPHVLSGILAIPLVPLGIYAIYPHPFYDPDACLMTLAAIAAILAARDRPSPARGLFAGALIGVPVWIVQTIGGAFLVLAVAALAVDAAARPAARASFRWIIGGTAAALAIEIVSLQLIAGIDRFLAWTWSFALTGRGVALERIRAFADLQVLLPGLLLLALAAAAQPLSSRARAVIFSVGLCLFVVWAWVTPTIIVGPPLFFPPIFAATCVLALARTAREGARFETLLPIVLVGTGLAAIESQGLNGSTYGIFPLLVLAIAALVRDLAYFVDRPARIAPLTGAFLAFALTVTGTAYTMLNVRLAFIDANAPTPVAHSTFPSLAGLSARGPYVAEEDTILFWVQDNVPAGDTFVFLPGEDLVFYALGRRPTLPSVYFFDVANPYSPAELARIADDVGLRWVFVKDRLQLREEPPLHAALVTALTQNATLFAQVGPYRIYRR